MNCPAVRDRFPEYALGSLPASDRETVERHLVWCAACRKEAAELEGAAAVLGFALAPVVPSEGLEPRVVEVVKAAATRGPSRRARSGVAAVLAAALAVAGLGWGAVMAGRAEQSAAEAQRAKREAQEAVDRFRRVLIDLPLPSAPGDTRTAVLTAAAGRQGSGAVLTFVSRQVADFAFVIVSDLPQEGAPYGVSLVSLVSADRDTLRLGRIAELDSGGGAELVRHFDADLARYTRIVVRDAAGRVILRGDVGPHSRITAPEA